MATQRNKQTSLTIRILGRDYVVACPPDEREALLSSAEFLSRRMTAIRKKGKTLGVDRIAVMAALNTTRELLTLQQEVEQLRAQISGSDDLAPAATPARNRQIEEHLTQLQLRIESVLDDSD